MPDNLALATSWLKPLMWPSNGTKCPPASKAAQISMKCFLLGLAATSLPTQTMHLDALVAEFAECIARAMPTVGVHPDLVGFFPPEHKDLHCFTDVKKTKEFVVTEKEHYAYECWREVKRSIRNSLLPLFLSVGRKLGYITPDRGITCPSGKSLQEFLVAFNQALFLVDEHDKTKKKSTRAKGKGDGRCTALKNLLALLLHSPGLFPVQTSGARQPRHAPRAGATTLMARATKKRPRARSRAGQTPPRRAPPERPSPRRAPVTSPP